MSVMSRTSLLLGLVPVLAGSLEGQSALPKPVMSTPTVIVGPASLAGRSTLTAKVSLSWPAVSGAEKYRLTRIENSGDPEVIIEELPVASFVVEGAACTAGSSQPACAYLDVTRLPRRGAGKTTVVSGRLYTYRVWAIFPGPIVSPPSPAATVQAK